MYIQVCVSLSSETTLVMIVQYIAPPNCSLGIFLNRSTNYIRYAEYCSNRVLRAECSAPQESEIARLVRSRHRNGLEFGERAALQRHVAEVASLFADQV